ncbi:hypothetical protein L9F63_013957, partial [Diploptera punctata]
KSGNIRRFIVFFLRISSHVDDSFGSLSLPISLLHPYATFFFFFFLGVRSRKNIKLKRMQVQDEKSHGKTQVGSFVCMGHTKMPTEEEVNENHKKSR